jgi:hypothetical protein
MTGMGNSQTAVGVFVINRVPISQVTLATSLASPQSAGTPIKLTATATGGLNDLFDFRVSYKNTAGQTVLLEQKYSSTNTFLWTPTFATTYTLVVWAKESASTTSTYDKMASQSFTIH